MIDGVKAKGYGAKITRAVGQGVRVVNQRDKRDSYYFGIAGSSLGVVGLESHLPPEAFAEVRRRDFILGKVPNGEYFVVKMIPAGRRESIYLNFPLNYTISRIVSRGVNRGPVSAGTGWNGGLD